MKRMLSSLLMGVTIFAYAAPVLARSSPDITCMKNAIAVRETAVQKAFTTYTQTVSTALTKRGTDLATAWLTSEAAPRRTAIKGAWTLFRTTKQTAKKTYVKDRTALMTTFKSAAKLCKVETGEDVSTETLDMQP